MTTSEKIDQIAPALVALQQQTQKAKRNAMRDDYRYADYESLWQACKRQLKANDLAVLQHPTMDGGIETVIMHGPSGQWVSFVGRIDTHGLITLDERCEAIGRLKRIGLQAALGIQQESEVTARSKARHKAAEVIQQNRTRTAAENGLSV